MSYEQLFRAFLQDALDLMNQRIRDGYRFEYVVDNEVEFTPTGIQTLQRARYRLYMLARESSEQFLQTDSATSLLESILQDRQFLNHINVTTLDGKPVTDPTSLAYWIKQRYLHSFVEQYVSCYEHGSHFPTIIEEEHFAPIYSELLYALTETSVTRHIVFPLWSFSMDRELVTLDDQAVIRPMSLSERKSLYHLVQTVGSFPLLGIDNVKYCIDVEFTTSVSSTDISDAEAKGSMILDALRVLDKGGVQAPLRFHTIEPSNRWRNAGGFSSSWSLNVILPPQQYKLEDSRLQTLETIWTTLTCPELSDNRLLTRLRNRLSHMYQSTDPTDRLVDALIGLESIYLSGSDRTEITYKLSSRIAVYLEDSFTERKKLKALIETLYNLRSKLVHGDEIKPSHLRYDDQSLSIHEFTDLAEGIFRRTLIKLLTSQTQVLREHNPKYFDDLLLQ